MSSAFAAEFAHLRAAAAAELPDWNDIRLVFQLLDPHATTPAMHDALDELMTAFDRHSLLLAVERLEAAFASANGGAASPDNEEHDV